MKTILCLSIISLIVFSTIKAQSKLRLYPFKSKYAEFGSTRSDSTFFLSPSVSFDVFVRESDTGHYKVGAIPGVGYGIRWSPNKKPILSLDIFIQANLSEELDPNAGFEYFNIDVLPILTFFNWFGIGYGPRFKIGLENVPTKSIGIFSFGIRKGI